MLAPVATKSLRHLVVVEILPNCGVRRGPHRIEQERDLLLLDQPADLLNCFWGAISIVEANEIDLAAVDPALLVDHLEVGGLSAADDPIGRGRPTVRHGLADLECR